MPQLPAMSMLLAQQSAQLERLGSMGSSYSYKSGKQGNEERFKNEHHGGRDVEVVCDALLTSVENGHIDWNSIHDVWETNDCEKTLLQMQPTDSDSDDRDYQSRLQLLFDTRAKSHSQRSNDIKT